MQGFTNQLIRDMRAVEVAGVDVIDTATDRRTQDGEGRLAVFRRSKHAGTRQLHGAVAHPIDEATAETITAGGRGGGIHGRSFKI